ncbi:MAG TPA: gluconokinase, GntK/IdnK-type [Acidimicrobiia bacterium]|nr:gluconokinase, GntK/IdnK-type [Acidimicrobiia bacterium]
MNDRRRLATVPRVVVMGVTGAGKTTIGSLLADALHVPFVDGDQFHDESSIAKMRDGVPLTDHDRAGWLARLHEVLRTHPRGIVLAASALTRASRDVLDAGLEPNRYILLRGDPDLIAQRIDRRAGHFAGVELLASQFALLDPPPDAIVLDVDAPPATIVTRALAALAAGVSPPGSVGPR